MTARNPLVLVAGKVTELASGDTLRAGTVPASGATTGDVLVWNGSAWVAKAHVPTASVKLFFLTH